MTMIKFIASKAVRSLPARLGTIILALAAGIGPSSSLAAPEQQALPIKYEVDWPAFLEKSDMVWKKAPTSWKDAPFLGNGWIGMQLMADRKQKNTLRIEIARMDAQEHLPNPDEPDISWAYARYRLPIGYFTLTTAGNITGYDLRLNLWNAELTGTITTDRGTLKVNSRVHATQNVIINDFKAAGGENRPNITWNGYPNTTPRKGATNRDGKSRAAREFVPGPSGKLLTRPDGIHVWEMPLRDRGLASTAWQAIPRNDKELTLLASIAHSYPDSKASDEAADAVRLAASTDPTALQKTHRDWWHRYYPGAFLSFSDEYWEPFYWTQIYKIGAGMRGDGPVLDLQGPWTCLPVNAWGGVWWNLNTQLQYWPCYTGNRLDLAMSLPNTLKKYRNNLIGNVAKKYRADSAAIPRATGPDLVSAVGIPGDERGGYSSELGSLPWICHNLFLHYRMTMDDQFLRDDVYPLLKRAVGYYMHFLEKGDDGKLHLPPTLSPEYGTAPDCNYDLALLRWGCQTLLWSAERLNIKDPLIPKWKNVLANLTAYPVNENGYMIGRGVPFANTHRHFSHLFMVYPLHLIDAGNPAEAELADRSTRHWMSLDKALSGYSFTTAASIDAKFHRGDEALAMLNKVRPRIAPNTLYPEPWPVMETPLATLATIHDMILQSWNNVVHVFGGVPGKWGDIAFRHLRAEGAFLVSAQRKVGATQWIMVESLAGEPLRLRSDIGGQAVISGTGAASMKKDVHGDWVGQPAKGSSILLALPGVTPEVLPAPHTGKTAVFGRP